ncbi:MAG: NRDE family protein [Myxococcota bacterium]
MCTLIVLDRVVPGLPLLVASNRDEYYARPAARPARILAEPGRAGAGMPIVAPQDLEAGGTWMGVNACGLFAGLTNRATALRRANRRSRGLLVLDVLQAPTAEAAAERMRAGLEGQYNPFHIFYGDGHQSFLTRLDERGFETRPLEPGVHVIGNRDPEDPVCGKLRRIREALGRLDLAGPLPELWEGLVRVLRDHESSVGALEAVCIHTPGYGTRSSAVLALGPRLRRYWHADGPPCEAKYRDYSGLLNALQPSHAREEGWVQ